MGGNVLGSVPAKARLREPIEINWCGKTYQFREPRKRRADSLIGRAVQLLGRFGFDKYQDEDGNIDAANVGLEGAGAIIAASGDLLDWLYDALDVDKKERAHIEETYDRNELFPVWSQCLEYLQRPFVGSTTPQAPPTSEPETNAAESKSEQPDPTP